MTVTTAVRTIIYLRLSDLRTDDMDEDGNGKTFEARETKLRALATRLGWTVSKVIIENDVCVTGKTTGRARNASAFKRRKVTLPDGTTAMRVVRPGFREILDDFANGRADAMLAEDLDRVMRDPRDLEDLIDVVEAKGLNVRSLTGSLTLTNGGHGMEIDMARWAVNHANKSSRDTAYRVREHRERAAKAGRFGGGRRPFGFEADGVTVRKDEAKVIRDCSRRVLQIDKRTAKQTSLRQLAAELRKGSVPTVTGVQWTSAGLRDILLRPRNAGIMIYRGEEIGKAPWGPIVPEDTFRAVVGLLMDPSRLTSPGAAPKWAGSGIYLCGKCNDGMSVQVTMGGREPRYRCKASAHLARNAKHVDKFVEWAVLERLSRPDAIHLVPVASHVVVDTAALRAEADMIRENLNGLAEDRAMGLIDRTQMLKATERGRARLDAIQAELSAAVSSSPLTPLVGATDLAAAWIELPLAARRAVIADLFTVTIMPSEQRGSGFDPRAVKIVPKPRPATKGTPLTQAA